MASLHWPRHRTRSSSAVAGAPMPAPAWTSRLPTHSATDKHRAKPLQAKIDASRCAPPIFGRTIPQLTHSLSDSTLIFVNVLSVRGQTLDQLGSGALVIGADPLFITRSGSLPCWRSAMRCQRFLNFMTLLPLAASWEPSTHGPTRKSDRRPGGSAY